MCSENLFDSVKEIITLPCGVLPDPVCLLSGDVCAVTIDALVACEGCILCAGHATHQRCHSESEFPTCLVCARTEEDDCLTRDILVKASAMLSTDLLRCEAVRRYCSACRGVQDMQYSTLGTWCSQCRALKQ